jgi:hypothetical protein
VEEDMTQEYLIRVEGFANSYGLGTEVVPGVVLFKAGDYNLTKEELNRRLSKGIVVKGRQ